MAEETRAVNLTYREVQQLRIAADMLLDSFKDGERVPSSLVTAKEKLKAILREQLST